jgi:hypothetical protein
MINYEKYHLLKETNKENQTNDKNYTITKRKLYDIADKCQTLQMLSTYLHSTVHDFTEGSSISISTTHAFLFFMPYRSHP